MKTGEMNQIAYPQGLYREHKTANEQLQKGKITQAASRAAINAMTEAGYSWKQRQDSEYIEPGAGTNFKGHKDIKEAQHRIYENLGRAHEHYRMNMTEYQEQAAAEAHADGVDLNFEMSHRDQANFVADHAEADEVAPAAAEQHPAA